MKIIPRRALLEIKAAQPDDVATEVEAGTERVGHRRTTVTVERETLSFLMRRTVVAPADEPAGADSNSNPTEFEAGREQK